MGIPTPKVPTKTAVVRFWWSIGSNLPADAVQIVTDDTRAALAVIGADFYGNPADELHLIGITAQKARRPLPC